MNQSAQDRVAAAAAAESDAMAAEDAAYAKLKRVRNPKSVRAANVAVSAARAAVDVAVAEHRAARQAVLAEMDDEQFARRAKGARGYLYECVMSDYSVDSIRYAERDWNDVKAVAEARGFALEVNA